jgi:hypothetical protein
VSLQQRAPSAEAAHATRPALPKRGRPPFTPLVLAG